MGWRVTQIWPSGGVVRPRVSGSDLGGDGARAFARASRPKCPPGAGILDRSLWWNTDHSVEIDIVGVQGRTVVLAGSVKWARRAGRGELLRLRRAVEALPNQAADVQLVLMARDHVDGVQPSEALIVTAPDLYEP